MSTTQRMAAAIAVALSVISATSAVGQPRFDTEITKSTETITCSRDSSVCGGDDDVVNGPNLTPRSPLRLSAAKGCRYMTERSNPLSITLMERGQGVR